MKVTHGNNSECTTKWFERTIISSSLDYPMMTVTGYAKAAATYNTAANMIAISYSEGITQ